MSAGRRRRRDERYGRRSGRFHGAKVAKDLSMGGLLLVQGLHRGSFDFLDHIVDLASGVRRPRRRC